MRGRGTRTPHPVNGVTCGGFVMVSGRIRPANDANHMNRGFITPSIVAVDDCTFEALLADSAFQLFNGLFRSSGRNCELPLPRRFNRLLTSVAGRFRGE